MPADNAATVAPGAAVEFPQSGLNSGTITATGPSTFNIPNLGNYQVFFQVSVTEAGQLGVELNGVLLVNTVVGRATGTSQITGTFLINVAVPNSTIKIVNPSGNPTALTITPLAGGTDAVSAHLIINQIANNGANGAVGATGATGAAGPTGATGANGTNGADGATGATGPTGANGTNGADGATGPTGANGVGLSSFVNNGDTTVIVTLSNGVMDTISLPVGAQGPTGATGPSGGPVGPTGADGATGPTGANGTNGADGATGPTGANGVGLSSFVNNGDTTVIVTLSNGVMDTISLPVGAQGPTGPAGANGTNGADGATGPTGANGNDGATGPTGANGTNGADGATGPAGPTGPSGGPAGPTGANGADGATGPTGANGADGATGPTGANGTNGTDGATGPSGANGTNGADGATGPTGANGTNGTDGATGPTGANGTNGADGATGPTGATGATGPGNANGTVNYVAKFSSTDSLISSSTIYDSAGQVGIGTSRPTSTLGVQGSVSLPFVATGNLTSYNLGMDDYTLRRYGLCTNIVVPDATTCQGRIYIIINSYGTGSTVTLTAVNGQVIFDDVSGTHYETTGLPQNSRIKIQSDGANWIVVGY
jgi:hypothetical protein